MKPAHVLVVALIACMMLAVLASVRVPIGPAQFVIDPI